MTPEAWALVVAAILGSNGLFATLLYIARQRADERKIEAERRKDETIERLKIQLTQIQSKRDKVMSDEKQEDSWRADFSRIVGILDQTLKRVDTIEEHREDDYLATRELYERANANYNRRIDELDLKFTRLIGDIRPGIQEDTSKGLTNAIERSQRMYATRDVFTTFALGFRFPDDDDPRWQWCKAAFSYTEQVNVYKVPRMMDGNFVTAVRPGDLVWIITDRYSGMEDWGFVKLYNDPDLRGCIQMHGIHFENCKKLSRITDTIPALTISPAPG